MDHLGRQRILYAAEAVLIALGLFPLLMIFSPLALLAVPAPFMAGYAAYRPTWWIVGPREPRRYARQYTHLVACVSVTALLLFVLSLAGVI